MKYCSSRHRAFRFHIFILLIGVVSTSTLAAEPCEQFVGTFSSLQGNIDVQRAGQIQWTPANLEGNLCQGDTVRSGQYSRAAVVLINDAVLRIDQSSAIRLIDISRDEQKRSFLSLLRGAFQSFSRKPRSMDIDTPYLNGSIEGTEFTFRVEANRTVLTVFEGRVLAENENGNASVTTGESVVAENGRSPQSQTVVSPRDSVQWALYYPPVLLLEEDENVSSELNEVKKAVRRGDTAAALVLMDSASETGRNHDFYLYRAALLLSAGQVIEARTNIDDALALNPDSGSSYALRAVIKVVSNEFDAAVEDATRAIKLNPLSAASYIALSYGQQGRYQITSARNTLLEALAKQPDSSLAWSRLAELQLMLGLYKLSRTAAEQADKLAPNLSRTQTTLGFANLSEFRVKEARTAFEKSIRLDSEDPLPRLGLGLVKISDGALREGRADLEIAVALDSNNALYRAYLGKAYFEEKRSPLDNEQFEIAKQLDPLDPTPYLYNAIRLQTENRPVEALQDMQASIKRNDFRASYRSRLLLDDDRAARGTSIARLYKDLGFSQLSVNESSRSLTIDSSNAAAHRFLSDSYLGIRRHEIARVSELLQAQLFQDINVNPVQPSISETNLNIVTLGGPAANGFNEFTPLFARNTTQLNISATTGNHDTRSSEAVVSGLSGPGSFSFGAFTYDSDGWRDNNNVNRDLFNFYGQIALTPQFNIQTELSRQDSQAGDLAFNFDPQNFLDSKSNEREQDTARIGIRFSASPAASLILSAIHNNRSEILQEFEQLDSATTQSIDSTVTDKGDQFEARFDGRAGRSSYTIGAAYSDVERQIRDKIEVSDLEEGPLLSIDESFSEKNQHSRSYIYIGIPSTGKTINWTIGASFDDYEAGILQETSFNPKLGMQWQLTENLRLRAAALKVMKPALVNNRTVEPTQLAGFNQFFDDINGTKSWRYGLGIDQHINQALSWGGELTWRHLDEPIFLLFEDPAISVFEERREQRHKLYLYWTPNDRLSISGELVYDLFDAESGEATEYDNLPEKVTTISVPIGATFFHPSGFFTAVSGTFVDQEVNRAQFSTKGQGKDSFSVVDLTIGYRFSGRRGVASLGIKNLFDKEFDYQDDSYREFRGQSSTGPYFPAISVLAKISLNF